jgi:5-methylcytosine-specific restriction enzyme A
MPQPPWKAWYKTARWRRLRLEVFKRDLYKCQCGCGVHEGDTSLLVCDHKHPHRGDERLFWNKDNLQTLLKPCHDRDKQKAGEPAHARRLVLIAIVIARGGGWLIPSRQAPPRTASSADLIQVDARGVHAA